MKIKTSLKKIGGSYYAHIPVEIYRRLGLKDDAEIVISPEKIINAIQRVQIKPNWEEIL